MNNFIETLWVQFGIETQEHIEEIELNLVEIEQTGATSERVASLFRAFHSLKGLATAMDMGSFARLAHRAEDILGVIRDGEFPMNGDVISLLLVALDEIKVLRQSAVASHLSTEANMPLMELLKDTFNAMEQNPATVKTPAPPQSPHSMSLQADPEMFGYFVELAQEKIATIVRVLEPLCTVTGEWTLENSGEIALVADEIDALAYAARTMEFFSMVDTLNALHMALPTENQGDAEQLCVMTDCLLELHNKIRYIESSNGSGDAGAEQLHAILAETVHVALRQLFENVLDLLGLLQPSDRENGDLQVAQSLHAALSLLNSRLAFFMFNTNCSIILMLEDVFSRAARGELYISAVIIEMAREEVLNVMGGYRACSAESKCLRDIGEVAQRIQQLQDHLWGCATGCDNANPVESFRKFMGVMDINAELLKILSSENVHELMRAFEKGEHICEVKVHLESNEEMAGRFLAWIDSSGSRIITNRSVFINDKSWYEMLIVSPLPRSEIKLMLADLDPNLSFLHLKPQTVLTPGNEIMLPGLDSLAEPLRQGAATNDTSSNVIRVHGETLDEFMNLIGEMVLAQSRLNHAIHDDRLNTVIASLKQQQSASGLDAAQLLTLLEELRRELLEADQLLHNSLGRLQESAVGLRVVPVEMVFRRLPRMVRDLARKQGKEIRFEINGQDVRIDKAMVDILADPLLHLVRNSVDHGVELPDTRTAAGKPAEAIIRLSAIQRGNNIVIEIYDDGAGIDADKVLQKAVERGLVSREKGLALPREELLRFILLPGFSTNEVVTETSGRGVGMDVVMTNVMRIGGTITVDSEAGRGTTFSLRMPLSVAIQEVMIVEAAGHTLALPGRYVSEVLDIAAGELQSVRGGQATLLRGSFLPLHRLSTLLGYQPPPREQSDHVAVVLTNGSQAIGLEVDKVVRRQELFVKDIQESVAALPGVGGASILGNGRVVLILDGEDLLRMAKRSRTA